MTMTKQLLIFIVVVLFIQSLFISVGWSMPVIRMSEPDSTNKAPAYFQGDRARVDSLPAPKDDIIPYEDIWMYLKEKLDGSYQVCYSRQLLIHYTEPYVVADTQRLRFRIYDDRRNVVLNTNDAGVIVSYTYPVQSPVIQTGENWLTVVLGANCEYGRYYYLEVWDSKGERSYSRFKCVSIKDDPFIPHKSQQP